MQGPGRGEGEEEKAGMTTLGGVITAERVASYSPAASASAAEAATQTPPQYQPIISSVGPFGPLPTTLAVPFKGGGVEGFSGSIPGARGGNSWDYNVRRTFGPYGDANSGPNSESILSRRQSCYY